MRDRLRRTGIDTLAAAAGVAGLVLIFAAAGFWDDRLTMLWMLGSFGASITLLLACPDSPLGAPRASMIGNVGSAAVGVACQMVLGNEPAFAAAAAIVLSVTWMSAARAWHPPGGATALLAVVGGPAVHQLGWLYPVCPIAIGTAWLLAVAALRRRVTAPIVSRVVNV